MLSTGSEFSLSGLLNPNLCAASAGVSSVFWYFLLFKIFQVAIGFLHAFLVLFCFVLELLSLIFPYTLALILWDSGKFQSHTKQLLEKLFIVDGGGIPV